MRAWIVDLTILDERSYFGLWSSVERKVLGISVR
jgi:hypothetical protein